MIQKYRRTPQCCIYCATRELSDEHVVPSAIGGRLKAPILCVAHNNAASATDNAFSTWFAPWTYMLSIPRADGKIGTSFKTRTIDGREVTMTRDGQAREQNHVTLSESGHIERLVGDLKWIDRVRKKHSRVPAPPMQTIALPHTPPVVDVKLGLTDEAWPGIVKMALHFTAGFVGELPIDDVLRAIIFENEPAKARPLIRSVPWDVTAFGAEEPPRHEIAAYPGATATFVTINLFGVFALVVKLPGIAAAAPALRYVQTFDGAAPVLTEVPILAPRWDPPMNASERQAFSKG